MCSSDLFYAPSNTTDGKGTWVVVRAEDQRRLLQDAESFSSHRAIFSSAIGENWPLVPLEIDPPDHAKFRKLLNPLLSPKRMQAMEAGARERAIALIDGIKDRGSCDVMNDFAFPFAVSIFLQFLGLPQERRDEFLGWAMDLLHGKEGESRMKAAHTIVAFMRDLEIGRAHV